MRKFLIWSGVLVIMVGLAIAIREDYLRIETILPNSGYEFSVQTLFDGYLTIEADDKVINISEDDLALSYIAEELPEYIRLVRLGDDFFVIKVALHKIH